MGVKQTNQAPLALITGGIANLGGQITAHLLEAGWQVAASYYGSKEQAEKMAASHGDPLSVHRADLTKPDAAQALWQEVTAARGLPQLLIHNASLFERAELLETSQDQLERHMQIHAYSPFLLTQAFATAHQGASYPCPTAQILAITDSAVTDTTTSYAAYLVSKKALQAFVPMAAHTLAPHIRVNAIAPGTLTVSKAMDETAKQKKAARLPLQTLADSSEVLKALDYLLRAKSVTGQTLYPDGGQHLV